MAFFRQLQLLLWKNWLTVIRQPLWSLTLITWPLIIFIIIAATRNQFPPVVREPCYVGPRNLPSTGFFPFLQTLMCNTDSHCYNKSHVVDPTASKLHQKSSRNKRSTSLKDSSLEDFMKGNFSLPFPKDSENDPAALIELLSNVLGLSHRRSSHNVSVTNGMNKPPLGDQETLNKILESVNVLKRAICTVTLPMINSTTPDPLAYAVITFCHTNNTVFEVSLITLNRVLTELMATKPDQLVTAAGTVMMVFDQLQNQTSLWDGLLAIPQLFASGSVDQVLRNTESLLTNIQGTLRIIQTNFPEAGASLSTVHPLLAGGISLLQYVQNWPGKDVSIPLGDVVTLHNNSLSAMVKYVLQEVKIPLDKAVVLMLDRDMVRDYICGNSSNPMWLSAACSTGTVDMLLGCISPDRLAKQAVLAWSRQVASHDVSFAKGLLHALMGGLSPGGPNITRSRRSVETQLQNTEEELFLMVGQVIMEIIKTVPEVDTVVQSILRAGFQSMKSATLTIDAIEEIMGNALKDADKLKKTYLTLLTNQTQTNAWIGRVLDSVMEVIMKSLASECLTCQDLLRPFEWLLNTKSIKIEVWRSVICQNRSALEHALLMDWQPVVQKVQELYATITGQPGQNATLPMILSEWHKLYNNSLQFGALVERLVTKLGGEYWMNWMPDNITQDVTGALQQSVFFAVVNIGEKIEKSQLWPSVKNYFHMVYWVLNYRAGVTTQPANCSADISTLAINCNTGFNWPQFVQAMSQALMSPNKDVLVNCLKGSVNLLQHVYGDVYKHLAGSFLKQEIRGGEALSAYLINLMQNLDDFVKKISMLSDQHISNPQVMLPIVSNLLQSTGLGPLLPLLLSDGPVNVSMVIDVASKLGRLNQHIFTFNETDPTMPELERLIMLFLSLEGNLTLSLSHIMGHTLLIYSDYFHPDYVARFREAIRPFTNQTSAGFVEAILSAMELLKRVLDAPNGDPTNIILGYIRQLQEFIKSLYRPRKIQHVLLPTGELSEAVITDLHQVSKDFLDLLTPEGLQNLTQAGPDAAQNIIIDILVPFVPPEVRQEATRFLQDFKALQHQMAQCAAGQNCLAGISEIFTFLDQILDMMLSANGTATISLAKTNLALVGREREELVSVFFSLLLPSDGAVSVKTIKQTLHFIRLIMASPNITVSHVQNALAQSNLTLEELKSIAALAGAADIKTLLGNIMKIINVQECFEPQRNPVVTAQCVMGLINGVSGFLTSIPALRNETTILSLIPLIVNNTISNALQTDFSNPHMGVINTLKSTLANVKMGLQLNNLNTPEIMNEIRVLESLIHLAANTEPFSNLNATLLEHPTYSQQVYLTIIDWYLRRLANITSSSAVSDLLQPFFHVTQMQVTLQLGQTNFSVFVSNQIEFLIKSLQHPIDGAGVTKIGLTTVEILRRLYEVVKINLEAQNNQPFSPPIFNTTVLNAIELQVKQYLNLIQKWMEQPNVPLILTSMLQWGNPSINVSTPVKDLQHLLQSVVPFLSDDQLTYLSIISNVTQSLRKAMMVAEQPGGLQSDQFFAAILEAVQIAMQILSQSTGALPQSVQQNILAIVQDSLNRIVHSDMSFASAHNISLIILKGAESIVQQIIPEMQVPLQLAQTNFSVFVSNQIEFLTNNLQQPTDGAGVTKIGLTTVEILRHLYEVIKINLVAQNNQTGSPPLFNITILHIVDLQVKQYLDIVQKWMEQPNVPLILTSMLQWGNPSINVSTPVKDLQHLLQSVVPFLSDDQLTYLSIISNVTQSLRKAMMVAEQPGGLQSDQFFAAILEAVQIAMQILSQSTGALPQSVQQNILAIVQDSLNRIVHSDMSFASAHNISLIILKGAESIVQQIIPEMQVPLQLAQTNFSVFVSNQIEFLTNNLQQPTDGAGVTKIGLTTVEILRRLYEVIKINLVAQNNQTGSPPLFNITILHIVDLQVKQYLDIVQKWMEQPNVPLILTNMLQWGNPSINVSTPVKDLQHLLQTVVPFLSDDQQTYLSIVSNITQSLRKALMVAEQPGGLQSDQFFAAILEAVQIAMQILSQSTGALPHSVQQNILEIVQGSLKLIVHPDMSFASARNISLVILMRAESVVKQIIPEMVAEYLHHGIKVITTYFETVSTAAGPDSWNQLILNEMKTVQSFQMPNSTAHAYISVLINITHFILESGQGNMSLWACFENASVEKLPMMFGKMGKLLSMLWPLFMGGPGSHTASPSLQAFAHLAPVLQQVMSGKADQHTWDKLEKILGALLSTLNGTELWDGVPSVIPLFEKIIGNTVNNIRAQNVMILGLQMPVVTLMREIAQSVNSTHFNLSEVSERMRVAIEQTVQAAQKANGSLECSQVLKAWEPVRETAGLSQATMAVWCKINLQPVLEAYKEAEALYTNLNMSHMGVGPTSVDATAARIVRAVQSLYQVSINTTLVTRQLIMTFSELLSVLEGQPLSPEAQQHWFNQFQAKQLQNSLSSIKSLSDQLLKVAPFLQPYIKGVEKALCHILNNYHLVQNGSSSEKVFGEAAMIVLSSLNITLGDMNWGNFSGLSVPGIIREVVKMIVNMKIFGDAPMVYQALEQVLASNATNVIVQKVTEMSAWLASTQASGLDLLTQALPKIYDLLRPLLSLLNHMNVDIPANTGLFEDLAGNIIAMLRQLVSTGGLVAPMNHHPSMYQQNVTGGYHTPSRRHRREAPPMPMREPINDFIDLFYIDYPAMFKAISVTPSTAEILETVHVFLANPDLNIVMKGATCGMPWGLNASREATIDAVLGMLSSLTLPSIFQTSSMDLLMNSAAMLPDGFPFSALLKNITRLLARESQENLILMQQTINTAAALFRLSLTDPQFTKQLHHLKSQVCSLENTETVRLLLRTVSLRPGQLCHTFIPGLQVLVESLKMNMTTLADAIFQVIIGDPSTYRVRSNWTSVLTQGLNFTASSLRSLQINTTSPGVVTVGEMLRNKTAFIADVRQHMDFDPTALGLLLETTLPNNNFMIMSWLINLRYCNSTASKNMKEADAVILNTFCSMSVDQWYSFSLLIARHLNTEKFIYRMVLSDDVQTLVEVMLQVAETVTNMVQKFFPTVNQLQQSLRSFDGLNLMTDYQNREMTQGQRSGVSRTATFVTLSRALCSNGILALFGISKLPIVPEASPSFPENKQREEMIERFKIPRNATPFCMNMYLDMVNTTGGAIAWAFLKPMLMGQILYTPDTPLTRTIMEKANTTLQEFANLRQNSEDWIESSNYIINSAHILSQTLPMLQNSLGNSFVKNFIEMQTDINVGKMKETLSNFSNMTHMLEKNKPVLKQITTLSTLMVDLSSCIKFDRYRGYDSADQLNAAALELAKNRDLYASVIFKLPKDEDPSKTRHSRSASSTSSLPPKVSYTIRMHMDNLMRTDRVRDPYFIKDPHISARQTLRYNRGFIYLQEHIDRAIIETQTGHRVTEPAVQLQPFPYPCHLRDEYLEAISFVFPIMLMMAWVLFIADFVKKLVHERELRLHEYMKMMGVNPLSHFFAWFLECAAYLVFTIIILTLVLKFGNILPKSDGFLLFLYLCDYGLSILAFSYLISSFFDKTYIAGLSGSLVYILCFFPFIVVMAVERNLTFSQKSALSLFSPTCFSYASQYVSRYEAQGEGIHWSNSYTSPISGDTASFGWLCWLMLIDSVLYFIIGIYIRMVFPGKYGIPAPWYFPFKASFWADLCCCTKSNSKVGRGLFFANIMQKNQPVFCDDKGKGQNTLSSQDGEDFSELPVGVALHGLTKIYGDRVAIENLNVSFYESHVTSLLGHNGAGKTTTMSLLTGLFAPSSGSIEVYGKDMQANIDDVRKDLGVCMQYDVLFDHMTTKEHLLLYGQIKAPHWSRRELAEQVRTILEETGMYAHRHKLVGTLSGGMKRKLSISIAFIGGSRLVVLDEPTTGVDPCSRRSIWDIVIQHKKHRTIIMSTHHLDEAEVLSDRIAFLERGGLKCCGSPFNLKDKLGQGYKLTLTKKMQDLESEQIDNAELKSFIQAHVPAARLKEAQGGDLVYSLPPFSSSNASSFRSLLTALDSNLDALQLGGYGISDTTLEEVFLQLTHDNPDNRAGDGPLSISETISDTGSVDSFPSDLDGSFSSFGDKIKLTGSTMVRGMALAWQQMSAILIKRFHHSRRDWKGLIAQILLPVLFVVFAMGLGSIRSDLRHYPELELSPALYKFGPSYSFFSNRNPNSSKLVDTMMSFPGIDNTCLDKSDNPVCMRSTNKWTSAGNSSKKLSVCKCTSQEQICDGDNYQPPHKRVPSSQIVYNLSGINVEEYLLATANDFIRNRYGGFAFGMPLPPDLKMDVRAVPKNRTLSKVWFNPEGHHTMPAYLNTLNNFILRSNLPADKDPRKYGISVSSHPYFGRPDDEDTIVQGMLQILVAMCVLTGYSIMTASFAIYEVNEHHSGSKRLQHIAGISEPFYWGVNFLYDMVMYLIPVTLTIGVTAAFQIPAFTERQNLGAVALLLVLFGFATFPWMYLLSGIFKDAEMAFITYVCINLFISVNTIMSTSILYFLGQISMRHPEVIQDIFKKMSYAFLIFPQFNFGNGLLQLARMNIEVQILSGYGIDAYQNPFSLDAVGWMFISSFIQGLVFFTLRLLLNKFLIRKVRHLICGRKTVPQVACEDEDEDVAAEHLRVASGAASSDVLQVNQLTKVYQHLKRKVHAVKRLSVGIPAGECFGLLGVNGAGKTTTFKMLTGDVSPTDGTAQIRDWDGRLVDIMECRNEGINIGYCPQVDALDNLLTGEEHLYFYGRIRGISKRELDGVVKYLLKRLELNYHRNIITDGYSCGTRRKLSTALALIGHPQILLLDEPSSGMDPRTKRHLWKIISEEVKGKCAVVLTSHSMEECEALCSRLAIMVKGQFRCLGSLQHIKNRFGSGFTVKMYLAEASCDTEAITGFMQRQFPSTYLKDQHSTMVEYHVPVAPGGVADIFDQLESNKNALQIKHFSVSQTTLDEVFINFAMGKIGMETIPIHSEEDESDNVGHINAVET